MHKIYAIILYMDSHAQNLRLYSVGREIFRIFHDSFLVLNDNMQ